MLLLVLAIFLTSGFAALLYQVVWQRMLAIFSGADVYSTTIIVAAFMAGLGLGHAVGGYLADRLSRRASLVVFGASELAIAVFGVFSTTLYYDVLYLRMGDLAIAPGAMAAVLFASLLWPTAFMGASLPLLARAMTLDVERAARTVGVLYGCNTLGAAAGALTATWWLLPQLGLETSLRVGAVLNVACAVAVLGLAPMLASAREGQVRPPGFETGAAGRMSQSDERGATFGLWAFLYGFAGMLSLSFEIVWFRTLGVMMKSTAFTFGTVLAFFLTGLGLGAIVASVPAARVRRPAIAFLGLQAAGGLSAGLLLAIFVGIVDNISALRGYFGSYEPLNVAGSIAALRELNIPANFLRLYVGLPLVLVFLPTFLLGASFPFLQAVVQSEFSRIGRRVGLLLLSNILGSMLGTVVTGWVMLDVFGTAGTLRLLVAMSGLFGLLAIAFRRRAPLMYASAAATLLVVAVVSMPDTNLLWARLHGTTVDRLVVGEDRSGVSAIKTEQEGFGGSVVVFANGLGQSTIPYGDLHTALGALPAFLHPDPRDAAIIGLGSGDTLYAAAGRPGLERITSIEIIESQHTTLRTLTSRHPYAALEALLQDSRVEFLVGDGRTHLLRTSRRYDIIEADALRPSSAYSGNLYSDGYFRLVRDRLKPGGFAATWAPTERVHNAFVRVFPHVVSVPGVLIGSTESLALDPAAIAARLDDPRVRAHFERAGTDIERLLGSYLATPVHYGPDFPRDSLQNYNTDLFPQDEFDLTPPKR